MKTRSISLSDPTHPIPSETLTTEWKTVEDIRFPRHWFVSRNGVRVAEATVEQTRLNSGLNISDLAATPLDLQPVLAK